MATEIKGKIIQILPVQSGTSKVGKDFTKQDFIIETFDQYPKKVCIGTMNDKANLSRFKVNDVVTAHVNLESREHNSKWYTSVNAWKIEAGQQVAEVVDDDNSGLPF
jgi:hypothetical protein